MMQTNPAKGRVDWQQVRRRIEASERALHEALTATPKRIEDVYRRRAIRLAAKPPAAVSPGLSVLTFRVMSEHYALGLQEVAEVLPFRRCARVPGAAAHLLGMVNLHGEIRAVVDLAQLVTGQTGGSSGGGFVLTLSGVGREIGLHVDEVVDLREIREEDLAAHSQGRFVRGIAPGMVMLLDLDEVLREVFPKEETGRK